MEPQTPDMDLRAVAVLHGSVQTQLLRVIKALVHLEHRIELGEIGPKSEANKLLGDVRDWLKIAHEMEVRLEKQRQDTAGSGSGNSLDLNGARSQIGCRLDRLRRTACPGCLSG